MYMNNPLSEKMPVITSSNKLRTYTSARYYTDDEIVEQITAPADNNSSTKERAAAAAKKTLKLPAKLVLDRMKQSRASSDPLLRRKGGR